LLLVEGGRAEIVDGMVGEMMGVTCLAAGNPLFAPDDQNNMTRFNAAWVGWEWVVNT
jgi:hypothetical protein